MLIKLLLFYCFVNSNAFEIISAKFMNFKGITRCIFATCGFKTAQHPFQHSYFLSYYDLDSQNAKLHALPARVKHLSSNAGIAFDLDCPEADAIIYNMSSFETFDSKQWLFVSKSFTVATYVLKRLYIDLNSDATLAIIGSGGRFDFYEVYKIEGDIFVVNKVGEDSRNISKSKISRRRNFLGIQLKGGIALPRLNDSYESMVAYLESRGNVYEDAMQRKNYEIACVLRDMFNFSMQLVRTCKWGTKENNTWNGVIGLTYNRESNFSLTTVRISKERYGAVDYLPPTHTVRLGFMFIHPRSVSVRNVFLEPFQESVWLVVFGLMVLSFFLLRFVVLLDRSSFDTSISNLIVLLFGTFAQQGTSSSFMLISGKVLFCSMLFMAVLLYQFYSAFLVGSLLSEPPSIINSPDKLYNSLLRLGMEGLSYNYELMNITSSKSRNFLKRILDPKQNNVVPFTKGMCLIKAGGFAYHVDTMAANRYLADTMSDRQFCQLKTIGLIPPIKSSIILPKRSQLKEFFMNGVLRMLEVGIVDYHDKLWGPKMPNCGVVGKSNKQNPVGMEPVLSAFLMLICAMILSVVVLFLECIFSNNNPRTS